MSRAIVAPPEAALAQRKASDPSLSAWVAANAGSGKTYVLARRVVRLMLEGTPPGAILCLTFTKAAAATMANRVFAMLGEWTGFDDARLTAALRDLDGVTPSTRRLVRARRLFAEALETPGGLKVQTIHAFCERVLHQFPFEANVASQFTVMDDRGKAETVERAKLAVLLKAAADPDGRLGRALASLSVAAADQTVADLLSEAVDARDVLLGQVRSEADLDRAMAALGVALGVSPEDSEQSLAAEALGAAILAPSEWPSVAATLEHLSTKATERDIAARLRLAARDPALFVEHYRAIFFTKEGEPRKTLLTKAVRDAEPALAARFDREQERLGALQRRQKAAVLRDRTAALLTLAEAVLTRVEAEKAARGALDFDDLVGKTRALFARVDARWILYKLDQGIDHILVDEAQDTSPGQWELVSALVAEFTDGEGARETARTLFVVGDEKQSIYSFQGADPAWFTDMRLKFARAFGQAGKPFEQVRLNFSFRSTSAVLGAVDRVFDDPATRRGLSSDQGPLAPHEAARRSAPGIVELWPPIEKQETEERSPWTAPLDAVEISDPVARLADRIAGHIRIWLDRRERLPDKDHPIAPGDILILVRRRGALFEQVIRALKNRNVPVAGADRLVLGEHIAVMDLMALADCMLTPDDDLSLAAVLKSPLVGIGEDELLALAANRPGSLWDAVQAAGTPYARQIRRWRDEALTLTPASFFAQVLSRDGGRAAMLARLGFEAADAIDEFLSLALTFEASDIPTLRGFLGMMRASATEVKRDMDLGRDEVRVMTVHGAKGLEADIVFLADTMSKPGGQFDPKLFKIAPGNAPDGALPHLVWSPSKKADVEMVADAREHHRDRQAQEYRRLLYVAMTRAADKLIICGAKPVKGANDAWYDMIAQAFDGKAVEQPADDGDGLVRRWREGQSDEVGAAPAEAGGPAASGEPGWLRRPAPVVAIPPRPVTPSGLGKGRRLPFSPEATAAREAALQRGTLTHRLLQSLPDVAPERREEATRRFLARQAALDEGARQAIAVSVAAILADPRFAPLFTAASRAEVPIAGRLNGRPVSGQIDRLIIEPGRIIIADFKTNDPPPRHPGEVPEAYVTQLALYRALLALVHADRPIEAWLVWTAVPDIMVISEGALAAALAAEGFGP
ncbi:MAG: double-strand break repair helicase AddA [Rhizobiales bacterium]|nr:double-strand break repair helicase AddA [Hyphomicrobiales bacterium]